MIETDRVVIVGAGLAALYAALVLAPRPVLMISPDPLGQGASSAWAQGGVAAAMDPADSPARHATDTLRAVMSCRARRRTAWPAWCASRATRRGPRSCARWSRRCAPPPRSRRRKAGWPRGC